MCQLNPHWVGYLRWRVITHEVDSFGPDHSPHVHIVTHVDGTTDFIAGGPNQLQKHTDLFWQQLCDYDHSLILSINTP